MRPNEAQISIPAVGDDIFDSCFVDVCVLEDVGAARYIPQIFSQAYEYTGQDRIKLSAPNLRHLLIEEPKDANGNPAAAFAVSMLMTRDGRVMFEGAWAQFVALTDIDSFIEVGAADTGYAMPDFGNRNPATWAGGRYELQIIGVTAESVSHIVEFGAEPVSDAEFAAVNMEQSSDLAAQKASSPLPPSDTTAPVINQKAISAPVTVTVTIPPTREAQAMTEAGVPVFPIRAPVSKRPSSRTAF